jgi:hypothetical protein
MSIPKRHHYLPESYLTRFTRKRTDQGELWIYDIKKREFRRQTPRNTGVQGYYNAVENEDGTRDFGIEESFSRIESETATIINKIEAREPIDEKERGDLGLFVAAQMMRGPEFEEDVGKMMEGPLRIAAQMSFATPERARQSLEQFEKDTGKPLGASAEEMMEYLKRDDYQLKLHRNESLRVMANLVGDTAKRFIRMDWRFFHAPADRTFITTDNPFVVMAPDHWGKMPSWYGFGYGTSGTRKVMPLSDKVCLVMFDPGTAAEHGDLTEAGVREINTHLAVEAYRFVIAREEPLLRSLVRSVERNEKRCGSMWGGSKMKTSLVPVDERQRHDFAPD